MIDADKLSRAVTAPGGEALPAIVQTFGADMLDADGHLDRRRLAQVVFSDGASRRALEGIIHPLVQQATLRRIRELAAAGASCATCSGRSSNITGPERRTASSWTKNPA